MTNSNEINLLRKYDVPGPRYTSYPTVPHWDNQLALDQWQKTVALSHETHQDQGISLYIHLPYCESLCTYCGCNKFITKNHAVEAPYIQAVLKEWQSYLSLFNGKKPLLKEVHLGGGTPTFFSAENLHLLISSILQTTEISPSLEMGIEVHPSYTSAEQLETLHNLGFNRLSIGVQDFSKKVQDAINRPQTYESVVFLHKTAKQLGYTSINYDLIYGLPFQTLESIEDTFTKVNQLKPDRIAFYSYAHVPWVSKVQRLFSEQDLPKGIEKRTLYETGRELLQQEGYKEVGMDHFALSTDSLYLAYKNGTLHRNFMGYTVTKSKMLIGLGVSAISDAWGAYAQNEKSIKTYLKQIETTGWAVAKGHVLSEEDLLIKQHILNLMCRFNTAFSKKETLEFQQIENLLSEMKKDGLVHFQNQQVLVTDSGKAFVRNICMALDKKIQSGLYNVTFSQTI